MERCKRVHKSEAGNGLARAYAGDGCLIPGLPNDIAMDCLLRIPRAYHGVMRGVSRMWRRVFGCCKFYEERRKLKVVDHWLVVVFTEHSSSSSANVCCMYDLNSKQLLCRVPLRALGWYEETCAEDYKFAAIGHHLVLIGGKRRPAKDVRIYDTVSNKWKGGGCLQVPRCRFASGVIGETLYVAGGRNDSNTVEISTEVYNLQENTWKKAADMPLPLDRIEGEVVFKGKLYINGYCCGSQRSVVVVYDPGNDAWEEDERMAGSEIEDGQLVATEESIFLYSSRNVFYKFKEAKVGGWRRIAGWGQSSTGAFNVRSQRVFGMGNHIFVLTGEMAPPFTQQQQQQLNSEHIVTHNLFLGKSRFRAGAIVQA